VNKRAYTLIEMMMATTLMTILSLLLLDLLNLNKKEPYIIVELSIISDLIRRDKDATWYSDKGKVIRIQEGRRSVAGLADLIHKDYGFDLKYKGKIISTHIKDLSS